MLFHEKGKPTNQHMYDSFVGRFCNKSDVKEEI